MNALTQLAMVLLIIGTGLVAPHMKWPQARNFALVAIVAAVFFMGAGMALP